jgi:membrane protein
MNRLYRRGRSAWDAVMRDEITTSASSFAYHMIFAIPPLLILTVTIAALLTRLTSIDVTARLQDQIRDHAPASTRQLLTSIVDQALVRVSSGHASFGVMATLILALWSGSNAVGALIRAFNLAYGVEETRPFVQRARLKIILTLLIILSINVSFAALVFGHRIGHGIAEVFDLGARFDRIWNLLTIPLAIGAIAILLATLYYAGPNVDLSFRWISPGSLLATVLWLGATALFGLYLSIFNTGSAYGAVGSVVVLLFFFYVTGLIFLLGAKLNAEIGKRYDPLTIEDLATTSKSRFNVRASARRRLRNWLSKGAVRPKNALPQTEQPVSERPQ